MTEVRIQISDSSSASLPWTDHILRLSDRTGETKTSAHIDWPRAAMSHSEALPRLTVADTRREMIRWALGRASDTIERDWNCGASYVCAIFGRNLRAPRMGSRVAHLLTATALICGLSLAAPAAAQVSVKPTVGNAYTLTPKRAMAARAALTGLIGAVIGGLALARSAGRIGTGNGRRGALVALVLGPIALVMGGLVVATADGGLGTGNGLAGGAVAVIMGLIGMALGGLALSRSRRTA
jgi:Family of unknown function (DUF6223)